MKTKLKNKRGKEEDVVSVLRLLVRGCENGSTAIPIF
jgi:hypothetical protein